MENRLLLAILPYFTPGNKTLPYPGFGYLRACLKKYGYESVTLDFRVSAAASGVLTPDYFPSVTARTLYLHDIYELPLLISLAEKLESGLAPETDEQVMTSWALERDFFPGNIQKVITKTNSFALANLSAFQNYNKIIFGIDYTNLYLSTFTAILLKKQNPDVKIIFSGPHIKKSRNTINFLTVSGIADAVINEENPEQVLRALTDYAETDTEATLLPDYEGLALPRGLPVEPSLSTPETAVKEILFLKKRYNCETFFLAESLRNKPADWLQEFCELLIKNNQKIRWYGYFNELNEKQAFNLKSSGLVQADLELSTQTDFAATVLKLTDYGIATALNLVTANPGETEQEFFRSVYAVKDLYAELDKKKKSKLFRLRVTHFQPDLKNIKAIKTKSWLEKEKTFSFPEKYIRLAENTPCSYEISGITSLDVLNRLFLLKQISKQSN